MSWIQGKNLELVSHQMAAEYPYLNIYEIQLVHKYSFGTKKSKLTGGLVK